MTTPAGGSRPFRRPVLAADLSGWGATVAGPEQLDDMAARTAEIVVAAAAANPAARERLTRILDDVGIDTLTELWSHASPDSLAHALWTLHRLAAWCRGEPAHVARLYSAGHRRAEVAHAIAGAAEPPGPDEMVALGDGIVRGTWQGNLADACERAAAFTRVIAAGRTESLRPDLDDAAAERALIEAGLRTARSLESAAAAWRDGNLT